MDFNKLLDRFGRMWQNLKSNISNNKNNSNSSHNNSTYNHLHHKLSVSQPSSATLGTLGDFEIIHDDHDGVEDSQQQQTISPPIYQTTSSGCGDSSIIDVTLPNILHNCSHEQPPSLQNQQQLHHHHNQTAPTTPSSFFSSSSYSQNNNQSQSSLHHFYQHSQHSQQQPKQLPLTSPTPSSQSATSSASINSPQLLSHSLSSNVSLNNNNTNNNNNYICQQYHHQLQQQQYQHNILVNSTSQPLMGTSGNDGGLTSPFHNSQQNQQNHLYQQHYYQQHIFSGNANHSPSSVPHHYSQHQQFYYHNHGSGTGSGHPTSYSAAQTPDSPNLSNSGFRRQFSLNVFGGTRSGGNGHKQATSGGLHLDFAGLKASSRKGANSQSSIERNAVERPSGLFGNNNNNNNNKNITNANITSSSHRTNSLSNDVIDTHSLSPRPRLRPLNCNFFILSFLY